MLRAESGEMCWRLSGNQNRDGAETAAEMSRKQDAAMVGKRQWSALALHGV